MDSRPGLRMIEISPNYWRVVYPEIVLINEENFQLAKQYHVSDPDRAEKGYRQIMADCGDLYIDALTHLGMLLNNRNSGFGLPYIVQAFTQARLLFPNEFIEGKDFLLYESRGNAFVLTAYYVMGYELMKAKNHDQALDIFEFLIKINPKDNHGAQRWIDQIKQKKDNHAPNYNAGEKNIEDFIKSGKIVKP